MEKRTQVKATTISHTIRTERTVIYHVSYKDIADVENILERVHDWNEGRITEQELYKVLEMEQ